MLKVFLKNLIAKALKKRRGGDPQLVNEFKLCVDQNDTVGMKRLLEKGVLPKDTENGENSSLVLAASDGYFEVCCLLIEYGASVNYRTDIGESPLGCAVYCKYLKIVRLLLENGANPNQKDIFGTPMAELAKDSTEEIKKILIEYGMRQ